MNIGVNLLLWAAHSGPEDVKLIQRAADLGFDGVEIFIDDPENIDTKAVRRAAEDRGLGVTCCSIVGLDRDLISDDPKVRAQAKDYIRAAVDIAQAVGSPVFVGPLYSAVGKLVGRPRTNAEWQLAVAGIQEVAGHAAQAGVSLCLEPLNRFETYFLNTAADTVQFVREVGSPAVGVMLDTFHMNIEEKNVPQAVRTAGPLLRHMHCSENDRGAPGSGHTDWPGVFAALRENDYDEWLVIESFVLGNEAIAKAAAIWREIEPSGDDLAEKGLAFLRSMAQP